ncbi:MAG: cupredoxin domain-containing protein [Ktedonobacteraceae bacterium]|nr:cupredoxin domain-containing protein [Ktedonobacteraceae bacterium]
MRKNLAAYVTHIRFLWVFLSLASVLSIVLVACGGGSPAATTPTATTPPTTAPTIALTPTPIATVHVKMIEQESPHAYLFSPAMLTVKAGTEVIWDNPTDSAHTVLSNTGAFTTTGTVKTNQTYSYLFTKPGTYEYHCTIHPKTMIGTIVVTA